MRQISAMYEWSGGTDYRHTCYECSRCEAVNEGKRTVYRCKNYDPDKNWNAANIACKFFGMVKNPPLNLIREKKPEEIEEIKQMTIFDFI